MPEPVEVGEKVVIHAGEFTSMRGTSQSNMLGEGSHAVLYVLSGDCGACLTAAGELRDIMTNLRDGGVYQRVFLLGRASTAASFMRFVPETVPVDYQEDALFIFGLGATGTPTAIVVSRDSTIRHVTDLDQWPGEWRLPEVMDSLGMYAPALNRRAGRDSHSKEEK